MCALSDISVQASFCDSCLLPTISDLTATTLLQLQVQLFSSDNLTKSITRVWFREEACTGWDIYMTHAGTASTPAHV